VHRKGRRDRRRMRKLEAFIHTLKPVNERPPGLDSQASEDAGEDDRLWFESNPRANWRLRPAIDGELPGRPRPRWVVSFQFVPGVRCRIPMDGKLSDEAVRLMGSTGQFQLVRGTPVWIPTTDEAHALLEAGRLRLGDRWIPLGRDYGQTR
jgi:hypothetical protein